MSKQDRLNWPAAGVSRQLARRYTRVPLLLAGGVSLLAGLWAGLARAGLPLPRAGLAGLHGPLMVPGFLGVLIGLERAVGLGGRWPYISPLVGAVGTSLLLAGISPQWVAATYAAAAAFLVATMASLWWKHRAWYTFLFIVAAASLLAGNMAWFASGVPARAAGWWLAFLVTTIAAERMELSRVTIFPRWAQPVLVAVLAALFASLAAGGLGSPLGRVGVGLALTLTSLWLIRFDVAWRTVRHRNLPRFVAVALLSGFGWLAVAGVLIVLWGWSSLAAAYDASLHAVFLGFVFSMIFAHAPMIFPAILHVRVPFHPLFYIHLLVLHLSVGLRIAGDLGQNWFLRTWGILGNTTAVALFLVVTMSCMLLSSRQSERKKS